MRMLALWASSNLRCAKDGEMICEQLLNRTGCVEGSIQSRAHRSLNVPGEKLPHVLRGVFGEISPSEK